MKYGVFLFTLFWLSDVFSETDYIEKSLENFELEVASLYLKAEYANFILYSFENGTLIYRSRLDSVDFQSSRAWIESYKKEKISALVVVAPVMGGGSVSGVFLRADDSSGESWKPCQLGESVNNVNEERAVWTHVLDTCVGKDY